MEKVIQFPHPTKDGGKARIKRQRAKRFGKEPVDHLPPDPDTVEMPSDCA